MKASWSTMGRATRKNVPAGVWVLSIPHQGDRIGSLKARENLKDDLVLVLSLHFTVGKT